MKDLVAVVDQEKLQQKVNEYAQKGAEDVIKDFYNGYDSPYKKAIKAELNEKGIGTDIKLPDILALINETLTVEIDRIANTAIAKTYIPIVSEFLTRAPKEINLSEILKKFIEHTDFDADEDEYYSYEMERFSRYDKKSSLHFTFFHLRINNDNVKYDIHFHHNDNQIKIMSLPREEGEKHNERTMKLSLDGGATLELPYNRAILENRFVSYIARLVIAETNIIFDVAGFEDWMFPERDDCHC